MTERMEAIVSISKQRREQASKQALANMAGKMSKMDPAQAALDLQRIERMFKMMDRMQSIG